MTTGTRPTAATLKQVPRAQPPGAQQRACPECGERLSAYNPGPYCYAHTVGIPWNGPHHRP